MTKRTRGGAVSASRVTVALLALLLASACGDDEPAPKGAAFDPFAAPSARLHTAPADLVVGGLEILDPDGALDGKAVTVTAVAIDRLSPQLPGAIAAWELGPSGKLSAPIYVRVAAPGQLQAGESLDVWSRDADPPIWHSHSLARVSASSDTVVFAVEHFSQKALAKPSDIVAAFIEGVDCAAPDKKFSAQSALARGEFVPARSQVQASGAIKHKLDHSTALCTLERVAHKPGIKDKVLFWNDETGAKRLQDEYGHENLVTPLSRLATLVEQRTCGLLKLFVTDTYSEGGHSANSLHWEGRAVDIQLIQPGVRMYKNLALGRLALLASEAGFDWSLHEPPGAGGGAHLHASVKGSVTPTCTCGNGTIDPGEVCDDGNRVDGDGCSSNCRVASPRDAGSDAAPTDAGPPRG